MPAASISEPVATEKAAILAVFQGMTKARYEKNAQAIAEPYASHAAIFNLAPPLVHRGIDIPETQRGSIHGKARSKSNLETCE